MDDITYIQHTDDGCAIRVKGDNELVEVNEVFGNMLSEVAKNNVIYPNNN